LRAAISCLERTIISSSFRHWSLSFYPSPWGLTPEFVSGMWADGLWCESFWVSRTTIARGDDKEICLIALEKYAFAPKLTESSRSKDKRTKCGAVNFRPHQVTNFSEKT
jgi:hypothetical protein